MGKVKFEQIGALGVITLMDTPLNLLGNELRIELGDAIETAGKSHLRGLILKVDEGSFLQVLM